MAGRSTPIVMLQGGSSPFVEGTFDAWVLLTLACSSHTSVPIGRSGSEISHYCLCCDPFYHGMYACLNRVTVFQIKGTISFCSSFQSCQSILNTFSCRTQISVTSSQCPPQHIGNVTTVSKSYLLLATLSAPSVTIANAEHAPILQHEHDQATIMPSLPHHPGLLHRITAVACTQTRVLHLRVRCTVTLLPKSQIYIQGQPRPQDCLLAPTSTPAVNALRQDRKSGSIIGCAPNVAMRLAATAPGIRRTATGIRRHRIV